MAGLKRVSENIEKANERARRAGVADAATAVTIGIDRILVRITKNKATPAWLISELQLAWHRANAVANEMYRHRDEVK